MYLKALEIQGFKSFPDRTRLTFEKDITAIVGPNGSGKSNISDALLWVMGEQRSKTLRGGKMEDVIFGGTEKRSPMGFAQVSLVLDNSAGLFAIDSDEVTITRRYYRSGESEYYLNREAVRLRDITELLMDTGLGRDGYSVIGQGRIAEIVSARSTDRREIFEEAAGIARYRHRKEEAERKLERTDENLVRINDKIEELEMQVKPLEKQAETARRFLILRDEQRTLEISVWMETLDRLHEQSESVNADYEQAKGSLEKAQEELNALYAASENYSEKMRECDRRSEMLRERQSQEESAAASCESAMAVLRTNLSHNDETIARIRQEMEEQSDRAHTLENQIRERETREAEIDASVRETEIAIGSALKESEEQATAAGHIQQELLELLGRENALGEELARQQTVRVMLGDQAKELEERQQGIESDLSAAEDKYSEATRQLHETEKELSAAKSRLEEINNIISGHRLRMGSRESRVQTLTAEVNNLTVDRRSMDGRIRMLSEMEKDYEGMGKAVKAVMRQAERGALKGIRGPVASLLSVDERYALAIETALGGAMQHIVVDSQDAGRAAIEFLKRQDGGRATFLPLSTIKPNTLRQTPAGQEGYLGVAVDLIRYDKTYDNIFRNLLGRTVVAESLSDAVRLSSRFDHQLRIVTLDGQLINAGGSMTGGSVGKNSGILSRANELKKLRADYEALTRRCEESEHALGEARRELESARYELEVAGQEQSGAAESVHRFESAAAQCRLLRSAADEALENLENEKGSLAARIRENRERGEETRRSLEETEASLAALRQEIAASSAGQEEFERIRTALSERLAELRSRMASLSAEREATRQARENLSELLAALSGDEEQRQENIRTIERMNVELQAELEQRQAEAAQRDGRIRAVIDELKTVNDLRLELEGKRTVSERAGQDKNREILDMQSICARYEQKKLSAEMEESQIVDKLWENYELSRSAAQDLRQNVENMAQAQKRVTELRREISRLGPVNVGAIEEYERVSERYNFLSEQRDDVSSAKRDLEKIIADITGEMKSIFSEQFKAIDESFRKVFLDLFGGGKASLELEDEDNILESGIEIRVQPPGKAVTTISLLSGGEKSFVAIALYFAIMKVRPTPFCIMDEIDAALDEVNVSRYASYMRSMAGQTQFIAITHHRGTMEEADMLYGVTMQEKGVTTVLSIDLEEAERSIG